MLTGYTIAVPITDKRSETVCKAYRDSVYCTFGGSSRILTDNGTEFKSREMKQICDELADQTGILSGIHSSSKWAFRRMASILKGLHSKTYQGNKFGMGRVDSTCSFSIQLLPMPVV